MPWLSPDTIDEQADALAQRLQDCELRSIGILAANSPGWALLELAATRAGICRLPLPTFFSNHQLRHVLSMAKVEAVFTDDPRRMRALSDSLTTMPAPFPGMDAFYHHGGQHEIAEFATVTFTSGTTGEPKGVCLYQDQLDRIVDSLTAAVPAGRHVTLMPMSTLLETTAGLHMPLRRGQPVFVPSNTHNLGHLLAGTRAATAITTPSLLEQLVQDKQPLPCLKFLAVGGAPVPEELLDTAMALGYPVYQGYGFSEAGSVVALNTVEANRVGSTGRPLSYCKIRIEDGEVVLCEHRFGGYLGEPAWQGDWYTGDEGFLDAEGFLHVQGRRGDVLVTAAGRNVSRRWLQGVLRGLGVLDADVTLKRGRLLASLPGLSREAAERILVAANSHLPAYAHLTLKGDQECPSATV
jgi:long-chain acyl-CoA synthetase